MRQTEASVQEASLPVGVFRCGDPQGTLFEALPPRNRDFGNDMWVALRERFAALGFMLDAAATSGAFELHLNVSPEAPSNACAYLILSETPEVHPPNGDRLRHAAFRKIFTWNDALAGQGNYLKFNFGHRRITPEVDGFRARERLCCMISGNKTVAQDTPLDLYQQRIRTIRWFERHAPRDFDLYGIDWNAPPRRRGTAGNVAHRLALRLLSPSSRVFFPSYRGRIASKLEVGRRYRFSICYENVADLPGYITEKIFDAFSAGMVPVYWGAPNLSDYVPRECYLDRREFKDHEALHARLTAMTEDEYRERQSAIADFMAGSSFDQFTPEHFARTIADAIVRDLAVTGDAR